MLPVRECVRLVPRQATTPIPHWASFVAMAALVVYGDLVTKWLAVTLWTGETHPLINGCVSPVQSVTASHFVIRSP